MIKKTVIYMDIVENKDKSNFEEIEVEEVLRFAYKLPAIRMYEQKTNRSFFNDYNNVSKRFTEAIGAIDVTKINELSAAERLKLLPLLTDPAINEFMLDIIPCLFVQIYDGKYVQNDETRDFAENSMWIMDLVNIQFFIEIFQEISANQPKSSDKKGRTSKKN
jgi:hypothetical protein